GRDSRTPSSRSCVPGRADTARRHSACTPESRADRAHDTGHGSTGSFPKHTIVDSVPYSQSCRTALVDSMADMAISIAELTINRTDIELRRAQLKTERAEVTINLTDIRSRRADMGSRRTEAKGCRSDFVPQQTELTTFRTDIESLRGQRALRED